VFQNLLRMASRRTTIIAQSGVLFIKVKTPNL
jgi:hypothetical protein